MADYIIRGTAADGAVRVFAAVTKDMVEESRRIHNTSPVVTAAMGRLLTAAAILGTTLKADSDLITLQIKGDGPMAGLLATADSHGNVKGYPFNPFAEVPDIIPGKLNVGGAIGAGTLTIMKDIGLKEPYTGQIELVTGEIAEDLTYYFAQSEQTPTSIGLGVLIETDTSVRQAGGFMVQLMPDTPEEVIAQLEKNLMTIPYITDLMDMGKSMEEILGIMLRGLEFTQTEVTEVRYSCNCSRERVEKALISIGRKDLEEILAEDGRASLKCHFCNKEYVFEEEDLKKILENL